MLGHGGVPDGDQPQLSRYAIKIGAVLGGDRVGTNYSITYVSSECYIQRLRLHGQSMQLTTPPSRTP